MKRTGLLWVVAAAVVAVGCSRTERTNAQKSEQPTGGVPVATSGAVAGDLKDDEDFVHDVAMMNMAEIELSRMALDKVTRPDVKLFAQMMINDHGASGGKLKTAVTASPIGLPDQLDEKHRKTADELAKKRGADLDREYIEAMVHGHQDLAARLESRLDVQSLADWNAAAAGRTQSKALPEPKAEMADVPLRPAKSDSPLTMKINQWAADTYPVVQKHLDTGRALENATKKKATN